jgi:hypothetical protein
MKAKLYADEGNANDEADGKTEDDASKSDDTEDCHGPVTRALAKYQKLEHEMRKLDLSYKPQARETMARQPIIMEDEEGKESVEIVYFAFDGVYLGTTMHQESAYEIPTGINDALNGKESEKWIPSAVSKVMNFIKRKCWKKVPCSLYLKTLVEKFEDCVGI